MEHNSKVCNESKEKFQKCSIHFGIMVLSARRMPQNIKILSYKGLFIVQDFFLLSSH